MTAPRISSLVDGLPAVSNQGHIAFGSVTFIEGEDRDGTTKRILVDTAHVGRRMMIVDALSARGLTPLDIDYVVGTHAHWDHIQNVDLFTNAKLLMHARERKYSHNPLLDDWATPSWTGFVIEQLEVDEVGEGHEIIPGVSIMEMFGHSVGSIGVLVDTDDGRAAVTSDALHFAWVAQTRHNPLVFWDERHADQTIERVLANSDVIYPGHDMPFRVAKNGAVELLRTAHMTLSGIEPEKVPVSHGVSLMPGRHFDCDKAPAWSDESTNQRIHEVVARRYEKGLVPFPTEAWDSNGS